MRIVAQLNSTSPTRKAIITMVTTVIIMEMRVAMDITMVATDITMATMIITVTTVIILTKNGNVWGGKDVVRR